MTIRRGLVASLIASGAPVPAQERPAIASHPRWRYVARAHRLDLTAVD